MDNVYKRINDDTEGIEEHSEESVIQKLFADKTVFLTGSTGFLGKVFVEKLLRDCPDLKCLYLLIRSKKGLSVEERMKKYFDDVVFSRLRAMNPDFESKTHAIEGDLIKEDLGLSESDKKKIIEEVDFVYHNASNVKFTEKISVALKINAWGTAMILDLAMRCKKVQGFMYVSTAYSHSYQLDIKEQLYPAPADMDLIKKLLATEEIIADGLTEKDLKRILGKFSNTYVYSKATAEGLVSEASKRAPFPCVIYRPSIVLSSWKEPVRAWVDNLNGPAMLFIGYALGIIHVGLSMFNINDFIPVDMAVNVMFVVMWDAIKNRPKTSDALVYNYGSSTVKPMTVIKFRSLTVGSISVEEFCPSVYTVMPHFVIIANTWRTFFIFHYLVHCIPALFFDAYMLVTRRKTIALNAFKKVTSALSLIEPFMMRDFMIDITESTKAISRMNSIDHDLFFCDVQELDWEDYAINYWKGLRTYLLKDPLSTAPQAIRKYKKLQFALNCIQVGLVVLVVYFILTILGLM